MKKKEYSLYDLDLVEYTQVKYGEVIIPLKIDIADVTEYDYVLAISALNHLKIDSIEEQSKEKDELDDIQIISILDDKFLVDYSTLERQEEIKSLEFETRFNMLIKFINNDKIYQDNSKTFQEYYEIEDIKEWFYKTDMSEEFYHELSMTIYFWIDKIVRTFRIIVKLALGLDPRHEKDTSLNMSMQSLKSCYEQLGIFYFDENKDVKSFQKLSFREKTLNGSYNTKMYKIESKINEDAKKSMQTPTQNNTNQGKARKSSSRGKY